jgi:hypothetical protein
LLFGRLSPRSADDGDVLPGSAPQPTDAARALVRQFPRIGSFIAVLEIADDSPVLVEKTGTSPTHYDLFGEASDMRAAVVAVFSV